MPWAYASGGVGWGAAAPPQRGNMRMSKKARERGRARKKETKNKKIKQNNHTWFTNMSKLKFSRGNPSTHIFKNDAPH